MTDRTCPSQVELSAYALGDLPDEDRREVLDQHLDGCPPCQATIQTLSDHEDTLVSALRRGSPHDPLTDEAKCEEVIERVAAIARDPSFTAAQSAVDSHDELNLGQFGQYRLLKKLGQGGMGTVYKALHTRLQKVVAIKVLPANRLQNPNAVTRFEREMVAVGALAHPNIVGAHDAGDVDGQHFLVMEYVDGCDLSQLVRDSGPLPVAEACELVRQAAVGLDHAHRRGMVHRDIKPSNLMLARSEDGHAQVKILDMGLALLDEGRAPQQADLTTTGQLMGTLDYMAPEQTGDSHEVDIRADIYSLGATLYKLLSGDAPFAGPRYTSVLQKVQALASDNPPSIREKRQDVSPELAALLETMMSKRPEERFSTPAELAEALEPFAAGANLADLGIRNRETADELASATPNPNETGPTVTIGGHANPDSSAISTTTAAKPAAAAKPKVRGGASQTGRRWLAAAAGFAALVLLGVIVTFSFKDGTVVIKGPGGRLPEGVTVVLRDGDKAIEVRAEDKWTMTVSPGDYQVEVEGGDDQFQYAKNSVTVKRFGKTILTIERRERRIPSLPPGPSQFDKLQPGDIDPEELAALRALTRPRADLGRFELAKARAAREAALEPVGIFGDSRLKDPGFQTTSVTFSPDGKWIASWAAPKLTLWDAETGWPVWSVRTGAEYSGHGPDAIAFSPDGTQIAAPAAEGEANRVKSYSTKSGEVLEAIDRAFPARALAFGADGTRIAIVSGRTVAVWDLKRGESVWQEQIAEPSNDNTEPAVAFSPDGSRVVSSTADGLVRIWNAGSGELQRELKGQAGVARSVAFSPDGSQVASGMHSGEICLWNAQTGELSSRIDAGGAVDSVRFSPGGEQIAAAVDGDSVRFWSAKTGAVADQPIPVRTLTCFAFDSKGGRIVTGGGDRVLRIWDAETHELLLPPKGGGRPVSVDVSPDGRSIALLTLDGTITLWDVASRSVVHKLTTGRSCSEGEVQFSPDGHLIAARFFRGEGLGVWDVKSGKPRVVKEWSCVAMAFSPDGSRLLVNNRAIDPDSGEVLDTYEIHNPDRSVHSFKDVAYSPDGRRIAFAALSGVSIRDANSGEEVLWIDEGAYRVRYAPDGKWILLDYSMRDAETGEKIRHQGGCLAIGPDGLLGTSGRTVFRLEDSKVVHSFYVPSWQSRQSDAAAFSPDGRHVVSVGSNGVIYVFRLAKPGGR